MLWTQQQAEHVVAVQVSLCRRGRRRSAADRSLPGAGSGLHRRRLWWRRRSHPGPRAHRAASPARGAGVVESALSKAALRLVIFYRPLCKPFLVAHLVGAEVARQRETAISVDWLEAVGVWAILPQWTLGVTLMAAKELSAQRDFRECKERAAVPCPRPVHTIRCNRVEFCPAPDESRSVRGRKPSCQEVGEGLRHRPERRRQLTQYQWGSQVGGVCGAGAKSKNDVNSRSPWDNRGDVPNVRSYLESSVGCGRENCQLSAEVVRTVQASRAGGKIRTCTHHKHTTSRNDLGRLITNWVLGQVR